jgi:HlyD family secretion protein
MELPSFIKQFFTSHVRFIVCIFIIIAIIGAAWYIFSNTEPVLGFYTVGKGDVISSVDIPGTVSSSNNVSLSFQESGQIEKIYVKEGDSVNQGDVLASLDASAQETVLSQQQAVLANAQANYQKLLDGATPQDIKTSQDAVNLAQQNMTNAYGGAMNVLNNAYTAIYNAYNIVVTIQNNYFITQDSEGIAVSGAKDDINTNMQSAQTSLAVATKSMASSDIDASITQMISSLNNAYTDINTIRTQCDQGIYFYKVTAADKATLDGQKTAVNTSLTATTALQQNFLSLKLALQTAQDQLSVITAPPTQDNIDAAKAQIASARAQIENAKLNIANADIAAPFSGIARSVVGQVGMVVSPNVPILSIINNGIMKIDAYASETDVAHIQQNSTANVVLDAYGDGIKFSAKVSAIDTAQTIVNGSPAYHVTLYFAQPDARILAGMTGNVFIVTEEHDNVIEVPSSLILDSTGNDFVLI